jgi:hypothetical protein
MYIYSDHVSRAMLKSQQSCGQGGNCMSVQYIFIINFGCLVVQQGDLPEWRLQQGRG